VIAYQVDGTFDDCQALAKQALCDSELLQSVPLTSANSINIARLLPQMFYYAFMTLRFPKSSAPLVSVPCGNLGNLTGGILAHLLGFKAAHYIAACNANRTFPQFLATGEFSATRSTETISNAMDVGNPSNFQRVTSLLGESSGNNSMRNILSGYSIGDDETRRAIKTVHTKYGYILDPHTAVAACALWRHLDAGLNTESPRVLVATAHPAKFSGVVQEVLGTKPEAPEPLKAVALKKETYRQISTSYQELKAALGA